MEEILAMFGDIISPEEAAQIQTLNFDQLEKLESKREVWLKEKQNCFSASKFHRLMGYEDSKEFPQGAKTYVIEMVLESETVQEGKKKFFNDSTEWGNETELEAVNEFMKKTGLVAYNIGEDQKFIKLSTGYVGCTPDGLIGIDRGLEVKCPDSKTHYERIRFLREDNFKEMLPDYYWQIQGCMYVTGRKKWYFVDYDPRFKNEEKRMLIIEIHRNDTDIQKLKQRLYFAVKDFKEQVKELRAS